jgi:thermitase
MSTSKVTLSLSVILIITFLSIAPGLAQGPVVQAPPAAMPAFVPGEIIVKFQPNVGQLGAQSSLRAEGLRPLEVASGGELLRVQVAPGQEVQAIAELLARGDVEYATFNYYVQALGDPNDPSYSSQWSLKQFQDHDIDAPEAWDLHTGSASVIIAVIDTGVDLDHPDLQAKIVPGYDYVNSDPFPDDDHGHGTHVAGIAAAIGNNGVGIAGVSWGARIMPIKVLNASGGGTLFNVSQGIYYAVANGAKVINLSLGQPGTSYPCTGFEAIRDAMQYALDNGRLVVVAAGNESASAVSCPAAYSQAMAVGSTDYSDLRSWFSNYGSDLDIAAPGSFIYSTYRNGGYTTLSGTSMATPHVAGLAALLWSLSPSLAASQMRSIIQDTADDLGTAGWDQEYGYGRINARRALQTVALQTSPSPLTLLIDDNLSSVPGNLQVTTANPDTISWTASISPPTSWLSLSPPTSGQVSVASSNQLNLDATHPFTYGLHTTNVIVTGTTTLGEQVGPVVTEVRLHYLPELPRAYFPFVFK